MTTTVNCPTCHLSWAVVPGNLKAHPGRRTETVAVRVPGEDVYGNPLGTVIRETSHWVAAGPSATIARVETETTTGYTWGCLCGEPLTYTTPRRYLVTCQHNAGGTGVCWKAENHRNPPHDLYVNPRHGAACECCGHQGTHWVAWGETAACGAHP